MKIKKTEKGFKMYSLSSDECRALFERAKQAMKFDRESHCAEKDSKKNIGIF